MIRKAALGLTAILLAVGAVAEGAEPEQVVVRNRLYTDQSDFELGFIAGLSINNSLTSMTNLQLDVTYHLTEAWALDLLAGYALGGPTDLLCQAQNPSSGSNCPGKSPSIFHGALGSPAVKNDLPNLWVLSGPNVQAGIRWEPVYGKLSLLTELPVHFKWFFAIDGGAAQFARTSVDMCASYNTQSNDCNFNQGNGYYDTLFQQQWSWLGSAATGLRFIFLGRGSIDLAIRDYVWADSYPTGFTGAQFTKSNPLQGVTITTGITNSLFADLGATWTF